MKTRLILFSAALLLLAGCFKSVSYKTTYVIKPLVQNASGDATLPLADVKAYAFAVDTTKWRVASYDDALAGIITSKENPSEKITTPIATAEPYVREGTEGWIQMSIGNPSQMVLVVDTQNKIYCYTQQALGQNLGELFVALVFRPWKTGNAYKDGEWSFYNQFYVPPTFVDFFVTPSSQAEQNGPTEDIASLKTYAYAVDTTAWYIASYDNAAAGIITSKTDPTRTRTNPDFTGYQENAGQYRMSVSSPMLMVVVVDQTDKLYAYSRQDVELEGTPVTVPLVFRIWKQTYLYTEDSWRVVNQALKPTQPENPDPENPDPENPDPENPASNPIR